jgi:signal transduction histidine kinase
MNNFKLTWLLLVAALWLRPSEVAASQLIRLDEAAENIAVGQQMEYYQDVADTLTFEEISAPGFEGKWQPQTSEIPSFGFTTSSYWFRFRMTEAKPTSDPRYLNINYPPLDHIFYHFPDEKGGYGQKVSGDSYPFAQRDILSSSYLFTMMPNSTGERYHYLKVRTEGSLMVPVFILSPAGLVRAKFKENLWLAGFLGVFLAMLLYNLLLFISQKDVIFLYFVLTGLMFGVYQATLDGLSFHYLWPNYPHINSVGIPFTIVQMMMWLSLFSGKFLPLKTHHRRIVALCVIMAAVISMLCIFVDYRVMMPAAMVAIMIFSSVLTYLSYYYKKQNFVPARLFFVGNVFFLSGGLIFMAKTVGLMPLNFFTQNSLQFGGALELILVSLALSDRMAYFTIKGQIELVNLNHQVEQRIKDIAESAKERRHTIKAMVNHVPSAIFMVDSDCRIVGEFTESCHQFFPIVRGAKLVDLFDIGASRKEFIADAIDQVFMDGLPSEVTLAMIPRRFQLHHKEIEFIGSAIRGEDGRIETILFTMHDITHLTKIEQEAALNEVLIGIVSKLTSFSIFLDETKSHLQRIESERHTMPEREIWQILHTMKGNCSLYGLHETSNLINQIEDRAVIAAADIKDIEASLVHFLSEHYNVLHIRWNEEKNLKYNVDREWLFELRDFAKDAQDVIHDASFVKNWVNRLKLLPADQLLGPIQQNTLRLAGKVGKKVKLNIINGETLFAGEKLEKIMLMIPHLIRNAIYHGLEQDRAAVHKSAYGNITLKFSVMSGHYQIEVSDDGAGLDCERIAEKSLELQLTTREELQRLGRKEILAFIFKPKFSTATAKGEIAGRGMGLAAVMDSIAAVGGHISLDSTPGQGTTFKITIPLEAGEKSLAA